MENILVPNEIWSEILSHVNIKTLIKCRRVSSTFCDFKSLVKKYDNETLMDYFNKAIDNDSPFLVNYIIDNKFVELTKNVYLDIAAKGKINILRSKNFIGKFNKLYDNNFYLFYAIEHNNYSFANFIIHNVTRVVYPEMGDNVLIRLAAEKGYTDIVKLLLECPDVDPGACNNQAIQQASYNGHIDIVKLLLASPKVDPSSLNNRAILSATQKCNTDIVNLLLEDPSVCNNLDTEIIDGIIEQENIDGLRLVCNNYGDKFSYYEYLLDNIKGTNKKITTLLLGYLLMHT